MSMETLARVLVIAIEIILAFSVIWWLRSQRRRTPPLPWKLIASFTAAGAVIAIIAAIIVLRFSFTADQLDGSLAAYAGQLIVFNIIAAAAIEEFGKYALGVFFLLANPHIKRASDVIGLLIIAGLGFALLEDVLYLLTPDTVPLFRLLSFYLHAGTSAIIGYSLGRFHIGATGYREVIGSVLAAISLHASYNLATKLPDANASFVLTILFTIFITVQMFILYRKVVIIEERMPLPIRTQTTLLNLIPKKRAKLAN